MRIAARMDPVEERACIDEIVAAYPANERYALAILQDVQRVCTYIPRSAIQIVHEHIGTPEAQIYAIATFYKALSLKPKGRYVIKVCDGTACHIRGSSTLVRGIEQTLGIKPGESTDDGLFSLELVNCVGSCARAPVMVVGESYFSNVTVETLGAVIKEYRQNDRSIELI